MALFYASSLQRNYLPQVLGYKLGAELSASKGVFSSL
jgi:hypothetical protein